MKRTMTIINRSVFATKDIEEISYALLAGQIAPSFNLICVDDSFKGVAITNMDRPLILIKIKELGQFAETFVHELAHLQQHQEGYADEDKAEKVTYIVTDALNTRSVYPDRKQS